MTAQQPERYLRQIMLPEIAGEGQKKISEGKVLVIGTGGLGSPALLYLAAAGIGSIGLIDDDTVSESNLNRQILHFTPDLGRKKTESAAEKLGRLNPEISLTTYPFRLTAENGESILAQYDFIIDATDNTRTKYLINDLCVKTGKAYSHGAVRGMQGHTFTYTPGNPCCRCLFGFDMEIPDIPDNTPVGVIGSIAGIIGTIQATEAIKYITGAGNLLTGRLLQFNALTMESYVTRFARLSSCRCAASEK